MTATARHELAEVKISLPAGQTRQDELRDALSDALDARQRLAAAYAAGRFSNAVIQPFRAEVDKTNAEVQRLLTESLTIEEAETLYGYLGGAIVHAKVWRGDFNKGDGDE